MSKRVRVDDLIEALNEDLAWTLGTIIRYNHQAAKAGGECADQVRALFRSEAAEELCHAATLAEAINRLGGEPTTAPMEFDKPHCRKLALEVDLVLGHAARERYRRHARLAADLEEADLEARLEELAVAEAMHAQALEEVLRCLWPVPVGPAH